MLSEIAQCLQSSPVARALTTIAALIAVIGGVYGFVKVATGLYQTLFPSKVSTREIVLHAELTDSLAIKRNTVRTGETLEGTYERGGRLVLSLRNTGRIDLNNLTVQIRGNARFRAEPSSHFDDGVPSQTNGQGGYIWHSKPGVVFHKSALPRDVGVVSWDRDDGMFWAQVNVYAPNLRDNAEFTVALRPIPESVRNRIQ